MADTLPALEGITQTLSEELDPSWNIKASQFFRYEHVNPRLMVAQDYLSRARQFSHVYPWKGGVGAGSSSIHQTR